MNNILKNRTVIGLTCIVLSLLICFGLTPLFNNALKAQTEIIRVTKDIKKGETITEDHVERVKVGAYNLPETVVKSLDDLKGKYALADFMKGDYILASKLTEYSVKENEYLYDLDGTKAAISVSIKSFALGLSGKLQNGDIVSIIASDYGEFRETIIPPELKYVGVLAVTNSKGIDGQMDLTDSNQDEEKELPSTVTLLVNTTQARILADLEAKSKIHIALVYRGDEANSKKFLEVQEEAIISMEDSAEEQENTINSTQGLDEEQDEAIDNFESMPQVQEETNDYMGGLPDEQ